jgi:beta-1,4-mannooligosaccharide/beta-1,4-mannosyl-N-acetylglucosamine phosphorylase
VVFTCGALLEGDRLAVYYGAADKVIGLAVGDVRDFLG